MQWNIGNTAFRLIAEDLLKTADLSWMGTSINMTAWNTQCHFHQYSMPLIPNVIGVINAVTHDIFITSTTTAMISGHLRLCQCWRQQESREARSQLPSSLSGFSVPSLFSRFIICLFTMSVSQSAHQSLPCLQHWAACNTNQASTYKKLSPTDQEPFPTCSITVMPSQLRPLLPLQPDSNDCLTAVWLLDCCCVQTAQLPTQRAGEKGRGESILAYWHTGTLVHEHSGILVYWVVHGESFLNLSGCKLVRWGPFLGANMIYCSLV